VPTRGPEMLPLLLAAAAVRTGAAEEGSRPQLPATLVTISQANGAACLDGSAPTCERPSPLPSIHVSCWLCLILILREFASDLPSRLLRA
jgi:hypothetical protein